MKNFAESGSRGWRSKIRNANERAFCCLHARGCGLMALPAGRSSDHNRAAARRAYSSGWAGAPGIADSDHIDPRYMRSFHPSRCVKTFGLIPIMHDLITLIYLKSKVFTRSLTPPLESFLLSLLGSTANIAHLARPPGVWIHLKNPDYELDLIGNLAMPSRAGISITHYPADLITVIKLIRGLKSNKSHVLMCKRCMAFSFNLMDLFR